MSSPHEKYAELFATDQRLKTGYGRGSRTQDFYLFLQGDDETHAHAHKKYFNGKTEIFVNALLLGYFHNRISDVTPNDSFNRIKTLGNEYFDAIIKMVFLDLCIRPENSNKTATEMLTELERYADGGIEILQENFQANEKLDLMQINTDVQERIAEKAEEIKSRLD